MTAAVPHVEARDLLDLLEGRYREPCPWCGRLHCLTRGGLLYGHGRRIQPCRGSWVRPRIARLAAAASKRGIRTIHLPGEA